MENLLIKANNLLGLRYLLEKRNLKGQVDLVYIDPPFATGNRFTMSDSRANTISNSKGGEIAYTDTLVGNNFINFLHERLFLIKQLMSKRGSIYLHIDHKVGYQVKIVMDEIFGANNFINDITRIKCNPKNFKRIGYGNIKDSILFYSVSNKPIWNEPIETYSEADLIKLFPKIDKHGRRYTTVPIHAPGETRNGNSNKPFKKIIPPVGRHWRTDVKTLEKWDRQGLIEWSSTGNPRKIIYATERVGKRVQDVWNYKDPQNPSYPTEKNQNFIDLIVKTSSNEGSIVLDCFCGSGTTLKSAHQHGRKWIGIEQSDLAINIAIEKLKNINVDKTKYNFLELEESENLKLSQQLKIFEETAVKSTQDNL